jgi:hypothetical protein
MLDAAAAAICSSQKVFPHHVRSYKVNDRSTHTAQQNVRAMRHAIGIFTCIITQMSHA